MHKERDTEMADMYKNIFKKKKRRENKKGYLINVKIMNKYKP